MAIPNVIYEKKFPQIEMSYYDQFVNEEPDTSANNAERDSSEFCKRIFESTVHVVMRDRVEKIDQFVAMARELAEFYEIDTTVTEYESKYVASFTVNTYDNFSGFKKIIQFSDDVGFRLDEGCICIDISFYTRAVFRNGEKIIPSNDLPFLK